MADFTIKLWQERQIEDTDLFNQFLLYWSSGDYQTALNILNNPQLSSKTVMASVFNVLGSALTYLQDNYFENVEDNMEHKLEEMNLAISRFEDEHIYNPSEQYYINNFVLYNEQYYMCIQDSLGNLPSDTNYWVLVGLKGEQGGFGTGLNLKYSWSPSLNYVQYDVVYLDSVLYVALQNNTNQNPTTSSNSWSVLMTVPRTSMTVSNIQPDDAYEGQIWIKMLN